MRKLASLLPMLLALQCFGQNDYRVEVMSWNVLNWPSNSNIVPDTTLRCPAYRKVINYVQPDVLVTMENTSNNSVPWFLNQVMNSGSYHYQAGTFINGYDTDNAIYYRDSLFDFVSNVPVHTSLRDISHFTLVFKATGDTLHIFSLHLKASQGYEVQRAGEIADLRQVTNAFAPGTNFLVAGDFNIYYETEPAYEGLLQDNISDDGNVNDAIHLAGTWNNPSYAPYHTQSTRITSGGGGSGGGMNDRFDMILYSNGIANGGGFYYIPGSYANIGNDGHHYDDAINWGSNTVVSQLMANALYDASDHLPIRMSLQVGPNSGIEETVSKASNVTVFPLPIQDQSRVRFNVKEKCEVDYTFSDGLNRLIYKSQPAIYEPGEHFLEADWKTRQSRLLFSFDKI